MTTQMIVRVDPELKAKVNGFARVEGKSVSEVVRELLMEYVKNRDIEAYIDELWDRIRAKIQTKGNNIEDIERIVHEVRTES
jgi:predicted transcriptional regulator